MPVEQLLGELKVWKSRFGPGQAARLRDLLAQAASLRIEDAAQLIDLHETLLFVCAYPPDAETLAAARGILDGFSARVRALEDAGDDLAAFEDPEVSGIAGTHLTAVFSFEAARHLSSRHGGTVRIDWERHDEAARLIGTLPRLVPLLDDDSLVEAEVPWREWLETAAGGESRALPWLLEQLEAYEPDRRERADRYQTLSLPLRWDFADSLATRTHIRLAGVEPFCHGEPLIRRSEVRLQEIPSLPPLPSRTVPRGEADEILALARDTSASRFRELHGFNYGDAATVRQYDAGRGVRFYLWEVEPAHRLPLRAYHAATIWKNGIPIGYFEALSLFDRMEAGFNLYYTFREGETAWLYRQLLTMFHHALGITTVSVDPYQIGHNNDEALDAGAFWFYRKLGFRSVDDAVRRRTAREEAHIAADRAYRSPRGTLRKLVRRPMVLELPGATAGEWDEFSARNVGLAAARGALLRGADPVAHWQPLVAMSAADPAWSAGDHDALAAVLDAKARLSEAEYLRRMQRHVRLRELFLRLGTRREA